MKTFDFLCEHNACAPGARWALSISDDMTDVWDAMIAQGKHEWLVWAATRPGVFPSSTLRKLACRFVRETPLADGRTVWDLLTDERSRRAVEAAERFVDGQAADDDLESAHSAADAAAYAAAEAAYAADYDAAAAAYAAADASAEAAANAASEAASEAADYAAADAAQIKMIAELGNPFRKEMVK